MFNTIRQSDLVTAISLAMEDPTFIYWNKDEITGALNEALLHWGALTSYWRDRGTFTSTPATPFYDLSVSLPLLRSRTYTVDQLCREIQYALFELPSGTSGDGLTSQFTITQITDAIFRAAHQLNLDLQTLGYTVIELTSSPPDGRVPLDQSIVAISRASFLDAGSGLWITLSREDEFAAQAFAPDWNLNVATPQAWSMGTSPPLIFQLIPPPISSGRIGLVCQQSLALSLTATFDLPDEFVHGIKWYALYSLLSSYNEGFDAYRAKYALERYNQIVAASEDMHSLNRVQINGRLIPLDTLYNLDAGNPFWMNQTGLPTYAATAWDMLALAPLASSDPCSITCDVVRSAPLPSSPDAYIQLGQEEIHYIIDYVRHVLAFKIGGTEFGATFALFDNFIAGAKARNQMLSTRVRYLTPLFSQAKLNEDLLQTA